MREVPGETTVQLNYDRLVVIAIVLDIIITTMIKTTTLIMPIMIIIITIHIIIAPPFPLERGGLACVSRSLKAFLFSMIALTTIVGSPCGFGRRALRDPVRRAEASVGTG